MAEFSFEIEGAPHDHEQRSRLRVPGRRKTWNASRLSIASASFALTSSSCLPSPKHGDAPIPGIPLGLTFSEATANYVIALVGAGMLCLPKNLADAGGVGGLVLLVLGHTCVTECALQIDRAIAHAELLSGRRGAISTYEDLAGEALGFKGQLILLLLKNTYWLGVLVVFTLFVTESTVGIMSEISSLSEMSSDEVRWFVVYPVFLLGSMVRDLRALAPFQPVAIAATFLMCGFLVLACACEFFRPGFALDVSRLEGSASDLGTVTATSIFACGAIVSLVPAVRSQMAQPERCPSSIRTSMAIVWGIHATVMCSGYAAYGTKLDATILETVGKDCQPIQCKLAMASSIAVNLKLCLTVPSFVFLVTSVFESLGDLRIHTPLSFPNVLCRISLMTVLFLLGMVVPHVREIIGLLSASLGITLALLMPLCICYAMKRRYALGSPARDCFVHTVVVMMCVCVAYYGITGNWEKLSKKMQMEGLE